MAKPKQDKGIFIGYDKDIRDLVKAINRLADVIAANTKALIDHGGSGITDKMEKTIGQIHDAVKANKDELAAGVQEHNPPLKPE